MAYPNYYGIVHFLDAFADDVLCNDEPQKPEWDEEYCYLGCCTYGTKEEAEEAYDMAVKAWEEECAAISEYKSCRVCGEDADVFVDRRSQEESFFCEDCFVQYVRDEGELPELPLNEGERVYGIIYEKDQDIFELVTDETRAHPSDNKGEFIPFKLAE